MEKNKTNSEINNIEFRNRMILLRKQKGWSQENLGDRLDVSRQTVSKWENGESKPEIDKLVKMSQLYNLTMDELINGIDENKPVDIETKVISDNNTQIIVNDEPGESKDVISVNVETKTENRSFIRRHLPKIIIALAVILLITYLGFSVYKFCILKEINDKFNEYKNVNNCYYERKEIVTNNTTGTAYILNNRYWYKEGLLKIEEIKTEDGDTQTIKKYINMDKEEICVVFENTKEVIKKQDIYQFAETGNGIIEYGISENYYKDNMEIIEDSLDILKSINIENDKYIKKSINQNSSVKKIYNKENGLIEQVHTLNENEEIKILYNIQLDIVEDKDIKIENIDLSNYKIIE